MINSFYPNGRIESKTFVLVIVWMVLFGIYGIAQNTTAITNQPAWKISEWRGGGIRGTVKSVSLDSDGNLNQQNGTKVNNRNVERSLLNEIRKSILDLNLPRTRTKIVKGKRIYDGIYSGLTITLSGKDYKIEGSSFYDAKYVDLTPKQQQLLQQLKEKWESIQTLVPEEKAVNRIKPPPIMTGKLWTVKVWQRTSLIKYDSKRKREYFIWGEKIELWTGRMTRRGQSLLFDAVWQNVKTGEEFGERVEMVDAVRERVLLRRDGEAKDGLGKILRGSYEKEQPTIIKGKTDVANSHWEATIETETDVLSKKDNGDTNQTKSSAVQSDINAPLNPANRKMVFRYEYYWHKARNRSWYIDEQGDIYMYSYQYDKKSFITPPTLIGHVDPKVLAEKRKLIEQAAKGSFTVRRGPTDSGAVKTVAFLPNAESGEFREIVLVNIRYRHRKERRAGSHGAVEMASKCCSAKLKQQVEDRVNWRYLCVFQKNGLIKHIAQLA